MRKKDSSIFISYVHDDLRWTKLLEKHLEVLKKSNLPISDWNDRKIKTGVDWEQEIMKVIDKSDIFILLVSTNFLGSDFIRNHEIPKITEKQRKDGAKIFSLIVSPCRFVQTPEISCFQAVNNPEETLSECGKAVADRIMLKLMDDIEECIRNEVEK